MNCAYALDLAHVYRQGSSSGTADAEGQLAVNDPDGRDGYVDSLVAVEDEVPSPSPGMTNGGGLSHADYPSLPSPHSLASDPVDLAQRDTNDRVAPAAPPRLSPAAHQQQFLPFPAFHTDPHFLTFATIEDAELWLDEQRAYARWGLKYFHRANNSRTQDAYKAEQQQAADALLGAPSSQNTSHFASSAPPSSILPSLPLPSQSLNVTPSPTNQPAASGQKRGPKVRWEWTKIYLCSQAGAKRPKPPPSDGAKPGRKPLGGTSIKVGCRAKIYVRRRKGGDEVEVEYRWRHNHPPSQLQGAGGARGGGGELSEAPMDTAPVASGSGPVNPAAASQSTDGTEDAFALLQSHTQSDVSTMDDGRALDGTPGTRSLTGEMVSSFPTAATAIESEAGLPSSRDLHLSSAARAGADIDNVAGDSGVAEMDLEGFVVDPAGEGGGETGFALPLPEPLSALAPPAMSDVGQADASSLLSPSSPLRLSTHPTSSSDPSPVRVSPPPASSESAAAAFYASLPPQVLASILHSTVHDALVACERWREDVERAPEEWDALRIQAVSERFRAAREELDRLVVDNGGQ